MQLPQLKEKKVMSKNLGSKDSMSSSVTSENKTEEMAVSGANGVDNSFFQLIVEKLDGKNFREWAQSIKLVIDGKGKMGYLTGELKKPASTEAATLQKWKSENSTVTAWLINSMKPSIIKTYLFLLKAKDVWNAVWETYSNAEDFSQVFEIKTRLWQMKQGEKEVTYYFLEKTTLWQELDMSFKEELEMSQ